MRLPSSKFECPRCGFGVRPGEEQCGRCGESLKPKANQPIKVNLGSVRMDSRKEEERLSLGIRSVETIHVARPDTTAQLKAEQLERKERLLADREKKLNALARSLDERTRSLDEEPKERPVDMDELRSKVREELTRQFEPELDALQSLLEERESELQEARLKLQMMEAGEALEETVDPEELAKITDEILRELRKQMMEPPEVQDVGVLRTYIPRLDDILDGGIPQGHLVLFNGAPGTMKSTLTYTILHRAAMNGTPGLYLSIEQSKRSILRQMERMGMPADAVKGVLKVADIKGLKEEMADQEGNWREIILQYIKKEQKAMGFKMFVLDSLESFKAMTEHSFARQDLKDLFDWFKSLGITVLVISENVSDEYDESNQGEAYLSDGIMELLMREMGDSRVQRWIRCVKMRGSNADARYYSMFHNGKEFNLSLPLANQPF